MGALDELAGAENAQDDDPGQDDPQGGAEPQAAAGGSTGGSVQGEQTWLVQKEDPDSGAGDRVWQDVGEVTVPPRTKRRTIVEKALEDFPAMVPTQEDGEVRFRVLDVDSAAEIPVRWEVPLAPAAVLRVG